MIADYRINNGVLRFADHVTKVSHFKVPSNVHRIDFNNVLILTGLFDLQESKIVDIDFGDVLLAEGIRARAFQRITEKFYWMRAISGTEYITSERMKWINQHDTVYLSGTIKGKLELRESQRLDIFNSTDLGVYSPGNHITFGDPAIDKIEQLVYAIDREAMEICDFYLFDLNDSSLTPGTIAELGFVIGAGWHKTKKLFYMMNEPTENFFIKGLLTHMVKVEDVQDFIDKVNNI